MANVIFQISYEIKAARRDEYLKLAAELRAHVTGTLKKTYAVYELQNKRNAFVEQFTCASAAEYDALEDNFDEKVESLNGRIQELTVDGKARYSTYVEVG